MIDLKTRVSDLTDKQRWAARGAGFMAKAKATKAVWFPPEPKRTAKKSASKAKKAARKTTTRTAKKTT